MVIAISLTLGLITGCTNKVSDTNEKIYTIEQISSIKKTCQRKYQNQQKIVVLGQLKINQMEVLFCLWETWSIQKNNLAKFYIIQ